jgi:ankyrin repeat protein
VKLLLEKGAKMESKDIYGWTALSRAASSGQEAVVKLLLENGSKMELEDIHGWTALSRAVSSRQEAVVKLLLEKGAMIDSKHNDGWTALLCAAEEGHAEMVKLLLEKGANLESKDRYGQTVLWRAALSGHEAVVKLLLEKGAKVGSKDEDGWTALLCAAEEGHVEVVKLLLEKGAKLESKDRYRRTALSLAASSGQEAVVKLLLEKGAKLGSKSCNGRTALSRAAGGGYEAVVELLIKRGAELDSKSNNGRTALSWAAAKGRETVVKLLLENGAKIDSNDNNIWAMLSRAAEEGHAEMVKLLLEKGAKVDFENKGGWTALVLAAAFGSEIVVKLLLEKGAKIDSKDKNGWNALLCAAEKGHTEVVKLLLEKGSKLESEDIYGRTALLLAASSGQEAVVKMLVEKGAELNSQDKNGWTALSCAAEKGHEAVVKLLLEKGAKIDSENKDSKTVLPLAAAFGHEAVVKLLLEKGAKIDSENEDGRTAQFITLCPLCRKVPELAYNETTNHQDSLESLHLSAKDGCQICYLLWIMVESQQIDIDFGPEQSSIKPSSLFRQGKAKTDYYGISAHRINKRDIECRSRGGYTTLLELDDDSSPWKYDGQHVERTSTTTASEESFSIVQQWVNNCATDHNKCTAELQSKATLPLPTRLVQVKPELRLVNGNSLPKGTPYIALSHCWGLKPIFSLRGYMLNDLFESIPITKLPKSFQDAVQFTQQLGVDYIWIDSLCIIQDSHEDWLYESARMKDVYGNCWYNLAVTGFPDGEKGMFGQRNPSLLFKPIQKPKEKPGHILFDYTHWYNGVEMAPLNQRAWVFQERMFSPRTIHFGRAQVFWECRTKMLSETFPHRISPIMKFFNGKRIVGAKEGFLERIKDIHGDYNRLEYWFSIVKHYNKLKLTKEEDRLAALSGVAQAIRDSMRCDYIAGLWKIADPLDFLLELSWKVESSEDADVSYRRSAYCAPSWSWASITGTAKLPYHISKGDILIEVLDVGIQPLGSDPTGPLQSAFLRIRGPVRTARISSQCRSLQWRNDGVRLDDIEVNGMNLWGHGQADACLINSDIADIGPGPFDLASMPVSKQPESVETTLSDSITICLLGLYDAESDVNCLWLRPTWRAENEFQRVGFFKIGTHNNYTHCNVFKGAERTITII